MSVWMSEWVGESVSEGLDDTGECFVHRITH